MVKEITLQFIDAINSHNTEAILSLMTEDHLFIDTYDNREDKTAMMRGWPGYFDWFPDYRIEVSEILVQGGTAAVFGYAGGTYHGKLSANGKSRWRLPAAWRVVVEDDKVKIWQVFADSKIPYEAMEQE